MKISSPEFRKRAAFWLFIAATIAWPVTQLTIARSEPPFTLGLSWFAISLTALDIYLTTDVRTEQDDDEQKIPKAVVERCSTCGR